VGQQVLHEIVIRGVDADSTVEWLHPPSFPDARAVLLPPTPAAASDPPGTRRQRRALHPARPGRLTLPSTPYRCVPSGANAAVERATPTAVLVVNAPPREGRPEAWRGLVGRVALQVQAAASRTRVGESARIVATMSGPGLMRSASFAWPRAELEASRTQPELFTSAPSHREQPGLEHVTRRVESLEIVPHAPGELWVPAIEVAWLDPETGRYATVSSEPFAIEVMPEEVVDRRDDRSRRGSAGPVTGNGAREWLWGGLAIAMLAGVGLAVWVRSR
jgi:hypothetical protein